LKEQPGERFMTQNIINLFQKVFSIFISLNSEDHHLLRTSDGIYKQQTPQSRITETLVADNYYSSCLADTDLSTALCLFATRNATV